MVSACEELATKTALTGVRAVVGWAPSRASVSVASPKGWNRGGAAKREAVCRCGDAAMQREMYLTVIGHKPWAAPIPTFVAKMMMPKEFADMFRWVREKGFKADIALVRAAYCSDYVPPVIKRILPPNLR
jgi:hypothetical protein